MFSSSSNLIQGQNPSAENLINLGRYRALKQPTQTAYIFLEDGETETARLTYQELDRQARAIAVKLQTLKAAGERALLLYPSGLEFIVAFLGCLYGGVIAVPLYPPRRNQKLLRLQAVVTNSQAKFALTTKSVLDNVEGQLSESLELKNLQWLTTDEDLEVSPDEWQAPSLNEESLAFLQYTSGSTGIPKGVMVSHKNLFHNSEYIKQAFELSPNSVSVSWLPSFHDMGLIDGVLQPLYSGFLGVLMSPVAFLQKPIRWLQAISNYRATHSGGPNFAYELCVNRITEQQREKIDLSCWTSAYNGAEPVRQKTLEDFIAAYRSCGFEPHSFYPCYGMAEATLMISGGTLQEAPRSLFLEAEALERHQVIETTELTKNTRSLVSCGTSRLDTEIAIVDPTLLTQLADNQVGEIWISGTSVTQGYWNQPEESARNFHAYLKDSPKGPFLRTGDLGFINNGELFITGRLKDLIIIRGLNHYPQDLELTVEKSHPLIRPTCAAAFSLETEGQEELVIVAEVERQYITRRRQLPHINLAEEIFSAIRTAISQEHQLQVHTIVLITPGSIPKTSSGKIQRYACSLKFREDSLNIIDGWQLSLTEPIQLDQTEDLLTQKATTLELAQENFAQWLRQWLVENLRIPTHYINFEQSFLNSGLDSVMSLKLIHDIENLYGYKIETTFAFDYPSITAFIQDLSPIKFSLNILNKREVNSQTLDNKNAQYDLILNELESQDKINNLLAQIEQLSEQQIDVLLRKLLPEEQIDQ